MSKIVLNTMTPTPTSTSTLDSSPSPTSTLVDQPTDTTTHTYNNDISSSKVPAKGFLQHLRQSSTTSCNPLPPPTTLQTLRSLLGGFVVVFLVWGFINSFGLFEAYYTSLPHLHSSPSSIAWIGSLQIFLLMLIGAYSGSASDSGYFRLTCGVGIFLFVLGVFMASISRTYWQLLLSHGVCVGLGNGLMFIPTMSVVATYFSAKHKTIALGVMLCGASVGGIVFPLVFNALLPRVGFGWMMRIFGFIALVLFGCSQVLLKKRLPPKDGVRILEFEVLKDGVFVLFVVGSFVNFLGLYFAFFFISAYARDELGLNFDQANHLLLVINGAGIPGRIFPMWLADQRQWKGIRPVTVQVPLNFLTSVLLFAWIAVKSQGSAYAFAACYGFVANAVQSLFPATLADMTLDPTRTGAQLGWGFTIGSFSCLTGNPIGGLLVQAGRGDYRYAQIYAGSCMMCGCLLVATVAWLRIRQQSRLDRLSP